MREFVYLFDETRFPYSMDDVSRWVVNYRKNKSTRIKVQVALVHGYRCFWDGRGKGPCCDDVECGHIFQNYKGGELSVENCMIECRSHNNQRRTMSIEEYIADRELITGRQFADASYTE